MMYLQTLAKYLVLLITCLTLVSCSGDDEVTGTGAKGATDVNGTAVNKQALQNNDVVLRDKSGDTVTAKTDEQGEYNFDVTNLTPPYLIRTETESGPLYSIATSDGVANISPLSDVVVRNWFSVNGSDIDGVFASEDENLSLPNATEINDLVIAISNLIATVYTSFDLGTDYDFIHDQTSADFIRLLANTTVILANNELSIIIETPPPSQQVVSILIAFNFSDDLSDDSTIAPSQPEGLSATAALDAVQLLWNVSRDNIGVSYYNIYRSDQADGVYELQADSTVAHYSDTPLSNGIQYCYQVEAVDASGQTSLMSTPYCAITPSPPMCNSSAGNFPITIGDSIELSDYWATQVDANDTSAVYSWFLDSKPDESQFVLGPLDVQTASFTFAPDVIGNYSINLEITADSLGCTGAGTKWYIQVEAPVVAIALVGTSSNPGTQVYLDGSASTGPASQGMITSKWSILSGPPGYFPLINPTSPNQATYTPMAPGTYEIQLKASNYTSSATDTVMFTTPAPAEADLFPIANGGENRAITIGTTVILDSSGSYDPNDATATIVGSWSIYTAPPSSLDPGGITMVSQTQSQFTPQSFGDYILQLSVHNTVNSSYPYYVTITVTP